MEVEANLKQRKTKREVNHLCLNPSPPRHSLYSIVTSFTKNPSTTLNKTLNLNQEEARCHVRNKRINVKKKVIKCKESVALRVAIPNVDDKLLLYFHYFMIKCIFIVILLTKIPFNSL